LGLANSAHGLSRRDAGDFHLDLDCVMKYFSHWGIPWSAVRMKPSTVKRGKFKMDDFQLRDCPLLGRRPIDFFAERRKVDALVSSQ
jgi:hypothetical protein